MSYLSDNFGWLELVFSGAVALGFGFYQLWSVNREIAADKRKREEAQGQTDRDEHSAG